MEKYEKKDAEIKEAAEPVMLIATDNASAQQKEQPQQHQQREQPQQKNWEKYVPKKYRKMMEKYEKKDAESNEAAEPVMLIARDNASAQQKEQPQQHQQREQPQQKNWERYVPKTYRKMMEKYEKKYAENKDAAEPIMFISSDNAS